MSNQTYVRMHRFGDNVAFDLDDIETLYISKDLARQFARMLLDITDDISDRRFQDSRFSTRSIVEEQIGDLTAIRFVPGNDVGGAA